MSMSKKTKQFLIEKNLYPAAARDSFSLEELIALSNKIKNDKDAEYERVLQEYDRTGIYKEEKLTVLKETLDYLHYGIKSQYSKYKRSCGQHYFGPVPR